MPPSELSRQGFRARQARLAAWLSREGLFAGVLDDFESARNGTLRWLCGQPTDAILVVFASGRSVLVPWDVNMAAEMAEVDRVIPYTEFKRSFRDAMEGILNEAGPARAASAGSSFPRARRSSARRSSRTACRASRS